MYGGRLRCAYGMDDEHHVVAVSKRLCHDQGLFPFQRSVSVEHPEQGGPDRLDAKPVAELCATPCRAEHVSG